MHVSLYLSTFKYVAKPQYLLCQARGSRRRTRHCCLRPTRTVPDVARRTSSILNGSTIYNVSCSTLKIYNKFTDVLHKFQTNCCICSNAQNYWPSSQNCFVWIREEKNKLLTSIYYNLNRVDIKILIEY